MAKPKIKNTISKKEWSKIAKFNKHIGQDGTHYVMKYDDKIGTYLQAVEVVDEVVDESINEVEMGDMGFVKKHDSIATVYGVMSGGKKVKVKLGKTGKVVVIDTKDIQILPESVDENFAVHMAVAKGIQNAKLKNPETKKVVKATTALKDKNHPAHKQAKSLLQRLKDKFSKKEGIYEGLVSPKSGHEFFLLTKDTPIKYITKSYTTLNAPGVLWKHDTDYIDGKKGAYLIDYFGAAFYVDLKKKFASSIYPIKDQDKLRWNTNFAQVDKAPEMSDWKKYLKESVNEEQINEWKLQLDLGKVNPSEFENWASDSLQKKHKIKVSGSGKNWTIVGKGNDDRMGSSADWISQLLGKAWKVNKIKVVQKESVNEAKDPEIITQLRDVVKSGYKTLKDPKSGKRMKVDSYSASAIVGVYDKLNPSNQEKFVKQGLLGMQSLAFKFIK